MKEIPLMRELLYEAARAMPWVRLFRRNVLKLKVIDARTQKDRMVIAGIAGQSDLYFYSRSKCLCRKLDCSIELLVQRPR